MCVPGLIGDGVSTASITQRVRQLIQDTGRPFAASVPVDGVTTIFDLSAVECISSLSPLSVALNGALISEQATPPYTVDYKHGIFAFGSPPQPAGAILSVQGIAYDYFDDDEVAQAVTDAFNLHVQDQDPLPVLDPVLGQVGLSSNENYLVSLLAGVELLWARSVDASQQVDIHTPEGVLIPRAQRFSQIMEQIQALQEQYKTLAAPLNVGLWRIEVLFQRRVSYTTNRLVPIFREQEYNHPYTGFQPTTGAPGAVITIYGRYFTGATQVTFGGVPSTNFAVMSDEEIQAEVPVGGQSGQVGIETPYGVVLSTAQFVVGQPPPFVRYGPDLVQPPIPPGL